MKKWLYLISLLLVLCLSFASCQLDFTNSDDEVVNDNQDTDQNEDGSGDDSDGEPQIHSFDYDYNLGKSISLKVGEEARGYFLIVADEGYESEQIELVSTSEAVALIELDKISGSKIYFYITALSVGECKISVQTYDLQASSPQVALTVTKADSMGGGDDDDSNGSQHSHLLVSKYNQYGHFEKCECGYETDVQSHSLAVDYNADGHFEKCECGYETDVQSHSLSIKKDVENHWYECDCGYRVNEDSHSFFNGTCTVCGEIDEGYTAPTETERPALSKPKFNLSAIPSYVYGGQNYYVVNDNIPYFTQNQIVTEPYEYYSPLDRLGRSGTAVACLNADLMPSGDRGALNTNPSGWNQASYPFVPGGFLYNRCHLIGWQLTGQNDNPLNLFTGTRMLNSGAVLNNQEDMLDFENLIADYLKENPQSHVMYRVEPIYDGNNLLASGVHLEALSVEDGGDGICFNVFIQNVQDGVVINYANGANHKDPAYNYGTGSGDITLENCTFVLNGNNLNKIHLPDCDFCPTVNPIYTDKTIEELAAEGNTNYCGHCKPELAG